MTKKDILNLIYCIIDSDPELPLEKGPGTVLLGEKSTIDSIGFVSFIVDVETAINEKVTKPFSLTDEKAFSLTKSPFRTIDSLADYILKQLQH